MSSKLSMFDKMMMAVTFAEAGEPAEAAGILDAKSSVAGTTCHTCGRPHHNGHHLHTRAAGTK